MKYSVGTYGRQTSHLRSRVLSAAGTGHASATAHEPRALRATRVGGHATGLRHLGDTASRLLYCALGALTDLYRAGGRGLLACRALPQLTAACDVVLRLEACSLRGHLRVRLRLGVGVGAYLAARALPCLCVKRNRAPVALQVRLRASNDLRLTARRLGGLDDGGEQPSLWLLERIVQVGRRLTLLDERLEAAMQEARGLNILLVQPGTCDRGQATWSSNVGGRHGQATWSSDVGGQRGWATWSSDVFE